MKRIFLAIAVLCYAGAVYGQDGGRIHRSEFVPFDTREDADALNRKNTDKYLVFAPELLNDGEEVLGIGTVVNLPNGWFDSFIYLHLENTGTAYTLRVNDRTVAVVEDPFAPADFDLTPYVKQGDNLILLELHESNTPELQKGFTPTPVKPFTNSYLFAQEKRSIRDFNVALIPDSTRKFGVLDLEVIVQNGYNYEEPITVGFDIYAPNGKLLRLDPDGPPSQVPASQPTRSTPIAIARSIDSARKPEPSMPVADRSLIAAAIASLARPTDRAHRLLRLLAQARDQPARRVRRQRDGIDAGAAQALGNRLAR